MTLAAWWIKAGYPTTQETVIVTHGYGSSRRDYNALLPSAMLAQDGFNVLLVDQRDTGESTCVDGRHSAGQDESDDFAQVAQWLVNEKGISPEKIGMFGVSGGAIATAIVPAKTDNIAAFGLEAPIFDFADTARKEVEFQGFPGWLWQLADIAARLRGVNSTRHPSPRVLRPPGIGRFCSSTAPRIKGSPTTGQSNSKAMLATWASMFV